MAITSTNAKPGLVPPTSNTGSVGGIGSVKTDTKTTSTTSAKAPVGDTFEAPATKAPVSLGGETATAKAATATAAETSDEGDALFPAEWGDKESGIGQASQAGGQDPTNV
jgi:hypothetical protein